MDTARFGYQLPSDAIAQTPVEPRDASRLLDARTLEDHRFWDLPELLEPGDLVVVNHTRVRHARLQGVKLPTGGKVEALVLRRVDAQRWEMMVKPARRLRRGTRVRFGAIDAELLSDPSDGVATVAMRAPGDLEDALTSVGEVPLPPYITATLDDPERYQTIFAQRPGSAAAPTAGLHFTPTVIAGLEARGIQLAGIELEVGIATFRPIVTDRVEDHRMHTERYTIPRQTVERVAGARARGGRVVAVGTTVTRALESAAADDGTVSAGQAETDLYITPGHEFRVVDVLVTNFHLPRSSLIVMVSAFMGDGWRRVYETALERGYRFLSFGDAMLCERR